MSKMGKRYDEGFRREAVRLVVEEGIKKSKVCRDLGISEASLYKWLGEVKSQEPETLAETESEELKRLRKENAQLKQEREILKKATAFFAKEAK